MYNYINAAMRNIENIKPLTPHKTISQLSHTPISIY